jgi:hypothetical protein
MASDQQVSARAVLRALTRLRRQGTEQVLLELEKVEPDLANFVMEEFSLLHRDVLALGGPPKRSRRLQRRLEEVVLTCVTTMREAHHQLWQAATAGTPLAELTRGEDDSAATGNDDDGSQPRSPE